ncbi:MAG: hypothetical protein JJ848_000280 [Prochlorococcus marinus CUG1439]|uniref:hypothetical protein n=1 Tax=Prochlorococcus sp. MIT 1314 TaxID=3096220 RepID=UPI001B0BA3E4|nr:hypothetical protein [Prochlorococcus sp. MIT 1314]MCR8538779.1 hypothetical protein [Prochlorococcus marinus CUG1439]
MKKSFERTLIICPHADDELFTFGLIYSLENCFKEIDLLLIGSDKLRQKETSISSKINKLNFITLPKDIKFIDSLYHIDFVSLKKYFLTILFDYDLILSPLIEGGHQDHDTVTAALLKCKETKNFNSKILLYSTYRSMSIFPNLFRCGIPKGLFIDHRYFFSFTLKGFSRFIKTILVAYKSQYFSWLLLLPSLFIAYILRDLNFMIVADNLSLEYILRMIPKRPLYQTYRGLKKSSWLEYIQY